MPAPVAEHPEAARVTNATVVSAESHAQVDSALGSPPVNLNSETDGLSHLDGVGGWRQGGDKRRQGHPEAASGGRGTLRNGCGDGRGADAGSHAKAPSGGHAPTSRVGVGAARSKQASCSAARPTRAPARVLPRPSRKATPSSHPDSRI